jgi:hypothetical protein
MVLVVVTVAIAVGVGVCLGLPPSDGHYLMKIHGEESETVTLKDGTIHNADGMPVAQTLAGNRLFICSIGVAHPIGYLHWKVHVKGHTATIKLEKTS